VPDTDGAAGSSGAVRQVLAAAREAGFLGPGPTERHLAHAEGFVSMIRTLELPEKQQLLDLGSGGGLPGLVVAAAWPSVRMVLLDANARRCEFLELRAKSRGQGIF
jgi:methylase of polypeptide subunit release factors